MTADRERHCPGSPFPPDVKIIVTRHACERLAQRFRELEIRSPAEAAEVITLACQTGRVLRWKDACKYCAGHTTGATGHSCYSHELGGVMVLVFDNAGVRDLLSSRYLVDRFCSQQRGHKAIDGGVVEAMKLAKRREYVHTPSMTQHVGEESSMGNASHAKAETFPGEEFDATCLLGRDGS